MAIQYAEPETEKNKGGRPKSNRVVVSLRLDPEIVHAFRSTGEGWQSRVNDVLRANMPTPSRPLVKAK